MADLPIRKKTVIIEEINQEGNKKLSSSLRKVAAVAVLENPYTNEYVDDLNILSGWGEILGEELTSTAVEKLGGQNSVESYGKGGLVGEDGEREHVAAIIHPRLGQPMRKVIGGGEAIIPSTKKVGQQGSTIDIPTHNKDDEWVSSHWDAMQISVPDAPKSDEIVIAIVVTDGGRPHPRI